jgi:hypothetical protein
MLMVGQQSARLDFPPCSVRPQRSSAGGGKLHVPKDIPSGPAVYGRNLGGFGRGASDALAA